MCIFKRLTQVQILAGVFFFRECKVVLRSFVKQVNFFTKIFKRAFVFFDCHINKKKKNNKMSSSTYYTDQSASNKLQYSDFSVPNADRQDVTEQFVNFRETSNGPHYVDVDNVKPVSDRSLHSYTENPIVPHEQAAHQPQLSAPQPSTWRDVQFSNVLSDAQFSAPTNIPYRDPQQIAKSAQQRYEQASLPVRNGAFDNTPVRKVPPHIQNPPLPRGHVMERFSTGAAASPADDNGSGGGGGAWDWMVSHWYILVIVVGLLVVAIAWWRHTISLRQRYEFEKGLELGTLPAPPTSTAGLSRNLETLNAL